jgi:hypothetical protein
MKVVQKLFITSCEDSMMWYSSKVGQYVPYLGEYPEAYKSIDNSGYSNIVRFEDAVLHDVPIDD